MNELDRLQCQLTARLSSFERKVARSEQIITDALTQMERPFTSFSGGVDSTVVLDMVLRQRPAMPVVFGDDGWDYPETLAFLAATETRYGFSLVRVRSLDPWRSWCKEAGRLDLRETPDAVEQDQPVWGNPHEWQHQWRSLTKDAVPLGGYDGTFMGMLGTTYGHGGESRQRYYVLHGGARPTYHTQNGGAQHGGEWHCCPLASWTKAEVWAYVYSRGLPYNPAYDTLARLDIPLERRRVAALTCWRALRFGSHSYVKAGWPSLWHRFTTIFPLVRAYG